MNKKIFLLKNKWSYTKLIGGGGGRGSKNRSPGRTRKVFKKHVKDTFNGDINLRLFLCSARATLFPATVISKGSGIRHPRNTVLFNRPFNTADLTSAVFSTFSA